MKTKTGFKPIPLSLKIVFVLSILWILGSLANLQNIMASGVPLFGIMLVGTTALIVPLLLDIIGPLIFLHGTWNRKTYTPIVVYIYMGVFIVNSLIAIALGLLDFPLIQMLIPVIVEAIFLYIVWSNRDYYSS